MTRYAVNLCDLTQLVPDHSGAFNPVSLLMEPFISTSSPRTDLPSAVGVYEAVARRRVSNPIPRSDRILGGSRLSYLLVPPGNSA